MSVAYREKKRLKRIKRIKYELGVICLLVVVLIGVMSWRRPDRAEEPAPTPEADQEEELPVEEEPGVMFEWSEGKFVRVEYGERESNYIDGSRLTDPTTKNAADLVIWAQMAWENQWGYIWGGFGDVVTEDDLVARIERYGDDMADYEDIVREKWMGRRAADCAGLIKGYGWYDPDRGGIYYGWGDMVDTGTDGLYQTAPDKGPIDTLPETPGLLVYAEGHVGVYIGDGYAIEAISHAGGVVKTKVADRPWTHWLQCPYIQYDT